MGESFELKTVDDDAHKLMASLYSHILDEMDPEKMSQAMMHRLTLKESRAKSQGEYMEILMNNVRFFVQIEREVFRLAEMYLTRSCFPSSEDFSISLETFAEEERGGVEKLTREFRGIYDKYPTEDERLKEVTFDFIYHELYSTFIQIAVLLLIDNPHIALPLTQYEPSQVLDLLANYCHAYVSILLNDMLAYEE